MQDFIINVAQVEELQMINDRGTLDHIFSRAKSTVVCGGTVSLIRNNNATGISDRFESFTTPEDLEIYRRKVYKYVQ